MLDLSSALLFLFFISSSDGGFECGHSVSSSGTAQKLSSMSISRLRTWDESQVVANWSPHNLALRGGDRRPTDLIKAPTASFGCGHCVLYSGPCCVCGSAKVNLTSDILELGSVLGHGSFSTVHLANSARWGSVAVKKVVIVGAEPTALKRLSREIQILRMVKHPNVVKLLDVHYEECGNRRSASLLFEPCRGGELFDFVNGIDVMSNGDRIWQELRYGMEQNMTSGLVKESDLANVVRQLLRAVSYLHQNKIAHRDLKLENVLLVDPFMSKGRCSSAIKLIDFGFSKFVSDDEKMFTACGSTLYIAPEVLAAKESGRGYGLECDIWAVGVISYILLTCKPPFAGHTPTETLASIRAGVFEFPDNIAISAEGRDFVKQLLVADPAQRATCRAALEHPWIKVCKAEKGPPRWEGVWNCVPSALRGVPAKLTTLIGHHRPAAART